VKIVVFGATGKTGLEFIRQALKAGHEVLAFVRNPAKLTSVAGQVSVLEGSLEDAKQVADALGGQEAVVSCLGPSRTMTKGFLSTATRNVTDAMRVHGVRRLIVTGGTIQRDENDKFVLMVALFRTLVQATSGPIVQDLETSLSILRASDLDWTVARFPIRLTDSAEDAGYSTGYLGPKTGSSLSRVAAARFLLEELVAGKFIRQSPVVYSSPN